MKHKHENDPARTIDTARPFGACLNPNRCNPKAHGGVSYLETCTCGATRLVNSNCLGEETEAGPWAEK